MKDGLVAIIMPAYNSSKYINESISGILNQTYTNWVLYVVDDCSTDNMIDLIPDNEKIVILRTQSNGGPAIARNVALDKIKEHQDMQYIAYCDSDDVWFQNHLEINIKLLNKYDMVYSEPNTVFEDGSVAIPFGFVNNEKFSADDLKNGNFISITNVVHNRDCLVSEFDERLDGIEDWDYWQSISESGAKIFHNNIKTTKIIKRADSVASWVTNKKLELCKSKHNG